MTDNKIDLQPLKEDDWQLLRAMRIRAVSLHPDLFYESIVAATNYDPSHWQQLLAADGNKFWGLFDDGDCIGITGIVTLADDPSGQTGNLGYSFVEPRYRRKGLGVLFYSARIEHAITNENWKKLIANHRHGNEPSRRALLKHGFQFVEKAMIDWPDGSRDYAYRYELDLQKLRLPGVQRTC